MVGALGDGGGGQVGVEVAATQFAHPGVDGQDTLIAVLQPGFGRLRSNMQGDLLDPRCRRLRVRMSAEKTDGEQCRDDVFHIQAPRLDN